MRPGCPVSSPNSRVDDVDSTTVLLDQPLEWSEMGDSMDMDLLPELSGETWAAATLLDELTADLPPAGSDLDLIVCNLDNCPRVGTVRGGPGVVRIFGVVSGAAVLAVADRESVGGHGGEIVASPGSSGKVFSAGCAGSGASGYDSPIVHDSLFAGHLGVSRMAYRLLGYIASCEVCLARMSPWDMSTWTTDGIGWLWIFWDMSVTTLKGNRYVLVMVNCFSQWTEACPLPNKMALAVADAFFQHIVCRFGMASVIHSDQGREFENNLMQELCLLCGAHKTRTTPYHPASDGLVERFNRTLPMILAMFAGENRDDWDDLLLSVMMAYRSSVHESTGFSPYRLMFVEEYTLPMDVGLPHQDPDLPDPITNLYAVWVLDALEVAYDQVRRHSGQAVLRQKRLYDRRAVRRLFAVGDWALRYYSPAKKCKLDWIGPYLVVSLAGWAVGIQSQSDSPIIFVHCQELKKIPHPSGLVSWIDAARPAGVPTPPVLGASTMGRTMQGAPSIAVIPQEGGGAS